MNSLYVFDIGYHNEQIHAYINVLNALLRKHKKEGRPVCATERIDHVNELTEAYFAQVGIMPKEAALERLSYIILFDELTDNHPDKVTREEYPIMSDDQDDRRKWRERVAEDMSLGDRRFFGRRKVSYTDDSGSQQVRNSKMSGNTDVMEVADTGLDLLDAINKAKLTKRQRQALWLVYGEEMTQEEAGFAMGISQRAVSFSIDSSLKKLRQICGLSTTENAV